MLEFEFYQPQTLDDLAAVLYQTGGSIVAGATDIIPRIRHNQFSASVLIDISHIGSLNFIEEDAEIVRVGALATHQEIMDAPIIQAYHPALVAASATVGCVQTRNRGTIGGNIANASPAADTVPALLVLDAWVILKKIGSERRLRLADFILGPGQTRLEKGEFIHSIEFTKLTGSWGTAFLKLGKRNGMAISVANAAAAVMLDLSGKIVDVRLALGSVAPLVIRCTDVEAALKGKYPDDELIQQAAQLCVREISPISDVRSTRAYRAHAAQVLAGRVLQEAVDVAKGKLP